MDSQNFFPWSIATPELLPFLVSVPPVAFCTLQKYFPSYVGPQPVVKYQLQLRNNYVVLLQEKSLVIQDYFQCHPDISFSLERKAQAAMFGLRTPYAMSFYKADQATVKLYALPNAEASLGLFEAALAKVPISHRDIKGLFKPIRILQKREDGALYQSVRCSDGVTVALRANLKSQLESANKKIKYFKEVQRYAATRHPNLCGFEGLYESSNTYYLAMQILQPSLREYIFQHQPEEFALNCLQQLIALANHLHSIGQRFTQLSAKCIFIDRDTKENNKVQKLIVSHFGRIRALDQQGDMSEEVNLANIPEIISSIPLGIEEQNEVKEVKSVPKLQLLLQRLTETKGGKSVREILEEKVLR